MAKLFKPAGSKSRGKVKVSRHKPKRVELDIQRLADDGRGIAHHNGKVVFVAGALPGETVQATVKEQSRRFDQAICDTRLNDAPERVEPFCQHYGACGGCQLQHLDIAAQRQHKVQRLAQALPPAASIPEIAVLSGKPLAYRHRVRRHYRQGRLGFLARQSNSLVEVAECPLLQDALSASLKAIRQPLLEALGQHDSGELRLAVGDDGRVGLSLSSHQARSESWCEQLAQHLTPDATLYQVASQCGEWHSDASPLTLNVYDDSAGSQLALLFRPNHFSQASPELNRGMVDWCMAGLQAQSGEPVADYFCGLGNFSRPLAQRGAKVLAVDLDRAMLAEADAQRDRAREAIDYRCADLFDGEQIPLPKALTKVLLDPPRAGAKSLCERLAVARHVRTVAYVSCDPATLKRDLAILAGAGFSVKAAAMVDMFPHTQHQESMVLLTR